MTWVHTHVYTYTWYVHHGGNPNVENWEWWGMQVHGFVAEREQYTFMSLRGVCIFMRNACSGIHPKLKYKRESLNASWSLYSENCHPKPLVFPIKTIKHYHYWRIWRVPRLIDKPTLTHRIPTRHQLAISRTPSQRQETARVSRPGSRRATALRPSFASEAWSFVVLVFWYWSISINNDGIEVMVYNNDW